MILTTMKTFIIFGLSSVIIFTSNAYAGESNKVDLNIPHSYNALITIQACKVNSKIKDKKVSILEAMLTVEEGKTENLFGQNKLCTENNGIYKTQAKEWKAEHKECTEELIKAKDWPLWKFDFKSMSVGSILTLLALLL